MEGVAPNADANRAAQLGKAQEILSGKHECVVPCAGNLANAAMQLVDFATSDEGQLLLLEVFRCYQDAARIAKHCRDRSRSSGVVKSAGGVLVMTGGLALAAGAIVATGGAALPVEAAIVGTEAAALVAAVTAAEAGAAAAVSAGTILHATNVLVKMGLDKNDAKRVTKRVEKLQESMVQWDERYKKVLEAAQSQVDHSQSVAEALASSAVAHALVIHEASKAAGAVGDLAWAAIQDMEFLANMLNALTAISEAISAPVTAVADAVVAGVVLGSVEAWADAVFAVASGASAVVGFVHVITGCAQAKSGDSETADMLDAQADALCILCHTMLRVARGTPASEKIDGNVPSLAIVHVHSFRLGYPGHTRAIAARVSGHKDHTWEVYLKVCFGKRSRAARPLTTARAWQKVDANSHVLTRVFPGQSSFEVQGYSTRFVLHKATIGDSEMGKEFEIDFGADIDNKEFAYDSSSESEDDKEFGEKAKRASIRLSATLLEYKYKGKMVRGVEPMAPDEDSQSQSDEEESSATDDSKEHVGVVLAKKLKHKVRRRFRKSRGDGEEKVDEDKADD